MRPRTALVLFMLVALILAAAVLRLFTPLG